MNNIVRVGSDYDRNQLIEDCQRILTELGEVRHDGNSPSRHYEDRVIEMRDSIGTILIYYKHHDGSTTKSRVAAGFDDESIYQGAAERILMLAVQLDDADREPLQAVG